MFHPHYGDWSDRRSGPCHRIHLRADLDVDLDDHPHPSLAVSNPHLYTHCDRLDPGIYHRDPVPDIPSLASAHPGDHIYLCLLICLSSETRLC